MNVLTKQRPVDDIGLAWSMLGGGTIPLASLKICDVELRASLLRRANARCGIPCEIVVEGNLITITTP